LSRADETVTRCVIEIDIDPASRMPRTIHLMLLTGVVGGTAPKEHAFDAGVEHMAFHYVHTFDTARQFAPFEIPKDAQKLLK
jgi:hypothetical protein